MKQFLKFTLATITGIIITSIIGMLLFFMVIGAMISSTEKTTVVQDKSMLVLNLENPIVDRGSSTSDPFEDMDIPFLGSIKRTGLNDIVGAIKKAADDDRIKCIYITGTHANAGMATIEEIRNALIDFSENSGKPIYAYGDNMSQTLYYLATVADKVVINPRGILDFQGLGGEMTFYKHALDKLGVEMQIVRHGKFKSAVEPYMMDKMSPESREQTMAYLNSMWNHMLNGISEKRDIPVDKLNELADRALGYRKVNEALEAGLIDATKYKDEVLDDLREITGIAAKEGIPMISASAYAKVALPKKEKSSFSRNKIAVIYASGNIGMPGGGSGIDGEKLSREIRKIRQDSTYKAIVLRVDSPGGSAFDSEVIWREMELAAKEKIVVASMGDYAASGGYYIACAANKIVAQPNTITGSIGIFGTIPNTGKLMNEKLGITHDVVKTNEHSDMISINRAMTQYERDAMQEYVEYGYDVFITRVADGRGMSKEAVDEIGQGRVWTGENALMIGLVDQLGGLDDAIELAAEMTGLDNYRTVELPKQIDPWQQLLKSSSDNVRAKIMKKELGNLWEQYNNVQNIKGMNGIYALMPYDITIR